MIMIALYASNDAVAKGKRKATSAISPELNTQIIDIANYYHLDFRLLTEVIRQESGFNSQARSNKGAMGLMQMIPSTARRFGVTNAYDTGQSLHGGSRYLVELLRRFNGRLDLALAGYNAGEGAVERYGNRVPPFAETQNYVRSITLSYLATLGAKPTFTTPNTYRKGKLLSSTSSITSANITNSNNFNKSTASNNNKSLRNLKNLRNLSKKELTELATLDGVWSRSNQIK